MEILFLAVWLIARISGAEDEFIVDCSKFLLDNENCPACYQAPFSESLDDADITKCKAKTSKGIVKGICVPKTLPDGKVKNICRGFCRYQDDWDATCENFSKGKKPENHFGVGDSCCAGERPVCCGIKKGARHKGAICEGKTLTNTVDFTGGSIEDVQGCCHKNAPDDGPWRRISDPHIIYQEKYWSCEKNPTSGNLMQITPPGGAGIEESEPASFTRALLIAENGPYLFVAIIGGLGILLLTRLLFCSRLHSAEYSQVLVGDEDDDI